MASLRIIGLAVALASIVPCAALADQSERPFWTEQAMFRFGEELFFTGRASCAATPEEGRQSAYDAAVKEMQDYARSSEIVGITIETQMLVEEKRSPECPEGRVNVWRLIRVPARRLDAIARASALAPSSSTKAAGDERMLDLTPKVGMKRDEVFDTFGQPKAISMKRGNTEVLWEYPQTGLKFIFDQEGFLKRWSMAAPRKASRQADASLSSIRTPGIRDPLPAPTAAGAAEGSVDLTEKLQKLQREHPRDPITQQYEQACATRWPGDTAMQSKCIDVEVARWRERQYRNQEALARQLEMAAARCRAMWARDPGRQLVCESDESDRIRRAFADRP